jgi:urea carboxylase
VLDVQQRLKDFQESIVFPKPGDIWNYRRIDREEYDRLEAEVQEETFEYKKKEFVYLPDRSLEDPHAYNEEILGVLYGD